MTTLMTCALLLNAAVLIPVTASLLRDAAWTGAAYGPREPARQILLAIYLAILALSLGLLVWPSPPVAVGLLLVQIGYKVLTPFTVGTWRNPVVASNLAIAAFHAVVVYDLWRQG